MDTWDNDVWRIAREHGLDAGDIHHHKTALGLTRHDLDTVLALHHSRLTPDPAAFDDAMIQLAPEPSPDPHLLHTATRQLFRQLARGDYGEAQVLNRICTGILLRRAGLTLPGLLGCYSSYLSRALGMILQQNGPATAAALCKVVLLDMSLVMHGYSVPAEPAHPMLSVALEQAADPVFITSTEGIIEYVNQAFVDTTGYSKTDILQRSAETLDPGCHAAVSLQGLWSALRAGQSIRDVFVNRRKDGSLYSDEATLSPLRDGHGNITHFLAVGKDVSDRIRAQQHLIHLAYHDPLTELPNRRLLDNLLDQALKRAQRHQRVVAVLQIDLDDFRQINTSADQPTGDMLLRLLAQRLLGSLRGNDVVARLNGDTFAIVLEDIGANADVSRVVNKVRRCLSGAIEIEGRQYFLTISIGVSLFPLDGQDAQTLLKQAGAALQQAKSRGGNTYQYYSRDLDTDAFYRDTLSRFLQALEQKEFELHYQCLAKVKDLRVDTVEALLRWRHPDRGLLQPRSFLGLLEETGLILPVGHWALEQACIQAVEWLRAGHGFSGITVNLSGQQFRDPRLIAMVRAVLKDSGLPPERLELEIPEAVLMKSMHLSIQTLHGLRDLGVRLAVDDFGTSHASLPNLLRLPLNTLKIDHRFVRDIASTRPEDAMVVSAIAMAHSLGYKAVAEGVETELQLTFLRERGCDAFQGFHHSEPMDPARLAVFLSRGPAAASQPLH